MTTCCFSSILLSCTKTRLEGEGGIFKFLKKEAFPSTKLMRTFGSKNVKGGIA